MLETMIAADQLFMSYSTKSAFTCRMHHFQGGDFPPTLCVAFPPATAALSCLLTADEGGSLHIIPYQDKLTSMHQSSLDNDGYEDEDNPDSGYSDQFIDPLCLTASELTAYSQRHLMPSTVFSAHSNAIFDARWLQHMSSAAQVVTASGDQTLRITDMETQQLLLQMIGHDGSVKTVAQHTAMPSIIASGGRDGAVCVWDTRMPTTVMQTQSAATTGVASIAPVAVIMNAHTPTAHSNRVKKKQKQQQQQQQRSGIVAVGYGDQYSVTAVTFINSSNNSNSSCCEHTLASASAFDDVVLMWDLRGSIGSGEPVSALSHNSSNSSSSPGSSPRSARGSSIATGKRRNSDSSKAAATAATGTNDAAARVTTGNARFRCSIGTPSYIAEHWQQQQQQQRKLYGISSMSCDSSGTLLASSCNDGCIYLYDIRSGSYYNDITLQHHARSEQQQQQQCIGIYSGHSNKRNFYIKSCISADGRFIISGSADHCAYVYSTADAIAAAEAADVHAYNSDSCRSNNNRSSITVYDPVSVNAGHSQEATAVAWCNSSSNNTNGNSLPLFASISDDGTVRIHTLSTRKLCKVIEGDRVEREVARREIEEQRQQEEQILQLQQQARKLIQQQEQQRQQQLQDFEDSQQQELEASELIASAAAAAASAAAAVAVNSPLNVLTPSAAATTAVVASGRVKSGFTVLRQLTMMASLKCVSVALNKAATAAAIAAAAESATGIVSSSSAPQHQQQLHTQLLLTQTAAPAATADE